MEKFNDPSFNPSTNVYPELHDMFAKPIELKYDDAPTPATPDKIKDQLADARAKLILV